MQYTKCAEYIDFDLKYFDCSLRLKVLLLTSPNTKCNITILTDQFDHN